MSIQERLASVSNLQNSVLQRYFYLEIEYLFLGREWKTALHREIEAGGQGQYSTKFSGAWLKLRDKGIENYSVEDMDVTILLALLRNGGEFDRNRSSRVRFEFDNIGSDRNNIKHLSGNESELELQILASAALTTLQRFAQAAQEDKQHLQNEESEIALYFSGMLHEFKRATLAEVRNLFALLFEDIRDCVREAECLTGIKRDVQEIKHSERQWETWQHHWLKYHNELYRRDGTYSKFLHEAAKAGIAQAYSTLADEYYEGFGDEPDYSKALYYLTNYPGELNIVQRVMLAGLYINGVDPTHTKEDGEAILRMCKSSRNEIVPYDRDGFTLYRVIYPRKAQSISDADIDRLIKEHSQQKL